MYIQPTTIKGAIWYQGEADSESVTTANTYSCMLSSMISDWRLQWSLRSETDALFPFGVVQLSVWNDEKNITCGDDMNDQNYAVAVVRYAQTGNYGYLPNPLMPNTFLATAIDLGDPNGPAGDVHPRFKQPVGRRLANAARNLIYGESNLYWFGPIAQSAKVSDGNVTVNFRNVGEMGMQVKNYVGFELLDQDNHWIVANESIERYGNYDVNIKIPANVQKVSKIRYNWYQAPCNPDTGIYQCSLYDMQNNLPAIPFLLDVSS